MVAQRLLVVATLLTATLLAACTNTPTGIDNTTSTMQDSLSNRKDQIPWH